MIVGSYLCCWEWGSEGCPSPWQQGPRVMKKASVLFCTPELHLRMNTHPSYALGLYKCTQNLQTKSNLRVFKSIDYNAKKPLIYTHNNIKEWNWERDREKDSSPVGRVVCVGMALTTEVLRGAGWNTPSTGFMVLCREQQTRCKTQLSQENTLWIHPLIGVFSFNAQPNHHRNPQGKQGLVIFSYYNCVKG